MKKNNRVIAGLMVAALLIGGIGGWVLAGHIEAPAGNYTSEMKMD